MSTALPPPMTITHKVLDFFPRFGMIFHVMLDLLRRHDR